MADSKVIKKMDQKLMEDNVIDPKYKADYQKVHTLLNSHVRKSGKILTQETFEKGNEALRKWLMTLYKKGASQERLTSYLRCGLAHLSFDFIESTYESIGADDLTARALQSFKKRSFHKSFFKVAASQIEKKKKGKIKPVKKKETKKKTVKKKTSSKKAVKKKSAKKSTKKKVTKTAQKKKSSKKSATKSTKKTNKKSVKKKSVKKASKKTTKKKTGNKATAAQKKKKKKDISKIISKLLGGK